MLCGPLRDMHLGRPLCGGCHIMRRKATLLVPVAGLGRSLATTEAMTRSSLPPYRWRIAWLLGLGVLVNYFDRVNLSVSHEALITTFGISNIAFGYLSGAYNWTYAMCQLPIGVLLDRFGVKRIGRISTFVWSIASFAAAVTPKLGGFFGAVAAGRG
jgi:sugar phosphate permease